MQVSPAQSWQLCEGEVAHRHIVLFLKHIRVPKTDPLLELFSSKAGTFRFQGGNFLVPREELYSSKGGTIKGKGIRERIAGK